MISNKYTCTDKSSFTHSCKWIHTLSQTLTHTLECCSAHTFMSEPDLSPRVATESDAVDVSWSTEFVVVTMVTACLFTQITHVWAPFKRLSKRIVFIGFIVYEGVLTHTHTHTHTSTLRNALSSSSRIQLQCTCPPALNINSTHVYLDCWLKRVA